jgi:hypothetical protein
VIRQVVCLLWLAAASPTVPPCPAEGAGNPFVALQQDTKSLEYQVKAAYLLRFSQFIYWTEDRFTAPDQPLVIAIAGTDRFGPILDSTVAGRMAQGHPIVIRRLATGESMAGVHMLFVGQLKDRERREVLRQAAELNVLTVGENDEFLAEGGGIGLLRVGETIRFSVNLKTAQRGGLRIDARALAVAYAVYDR